MSLAPATPDPVIDSPKHVAIIMDGNGRWAEARGLPRLAGHRRGINAVRNVVEAAPDLGIKFLTLFAFSSENWRRSSQEVSDLMGLLRYYLKVELAELHRNNVRVCVIGDRAGLAADIRALIKTAEETTFSNTGLHLCLALNYGARLEILTAVRSIIGSALRGEITPESIEIDVFNEHLYTADLPDPDLLIRTSGEQRLSNFLLWQLAYAELVFVDVLWPDFGKDHLTKAVSEFKQRERRFGAATA